MHSSTDSVEGCRLRTIPSTALVDPQIFSPSCRGRSRYDARTGGGHDRTGRQRRSAVGDSHATRDFGVESATSIAETGDNDKTSRSDFGLSTRSPPRRRSNPRARHWHVHGVAARVRCGRLPEPRTPSGSVRHAPRLTVLTLRSNDKWLPDHDGRPVRLTGLRIRQEGLRLSSAGRRPRTSAQPRPR